MKWRVIFTDSESLTGVAPECPEAGNEHEDESDGGVYDCCPHPHIETYSEPGAVKLAALLTELDAGPCL